MMWLAVAPPHFKSHEGQHVHSKLNQILENQERGGSYGYKSVSRDPFQFPHQKPASYDVKHDKGPEALERGHLPG